MMYSPTRLTPPFTKESIHNLDREKRQFSGLEATTRLKEKLHHHLRCYGTYLRTSKPAILHDKFEEVLNKQRSAIRDIIFGCLNYIKDVKGEDLCKSIFLKGDNIKKIFNFKKVSKRKMVDMFSRLYISNQITIRIYEEIQSFSEDVCLRKMFDNILQTSNSKQSLELEIVITECGKLVLIENQLQQASKHFSVQSIIQQQSFPVKLINEEDLPKVLFKKGIIDTHNFTISETLCLYSKIFRSKDIELEQKPPGLKKNVLFYHSPNCPSLQYDKNGDAQFQNNLFETFDEWRSDKNTTDVVPVYLVFNRRIQKIQFLITNQIPSGHEENLKISMSGIPTFVKEEVSTSYSTRDYASEDDELRTGCRRKDECFCPRLYFPRAKNSQSQPLGRITNFIQCSSSLLL